MRKATPRQFCRCCGSANHVASKCNHKNRRCHKCHRVGHLARVCKNVTSEVGRKFGNTHAIGANGLSDDSSSEGEDEQEYRCVHKLQQGGKRYRKLVTTVKFNTKNIDFEVDTGAELSTIPAKVYYAKLRRVELQPSSIILRQYDGTALPTMGEIRVEVSHGQHKGVDKLVKVRGLS